jgi:hypothetical protein
MDKAMEENVRLLMDRMRDLNKFDLIEASG